MKSCRTIRAGSRFLPSADHPTKRTRKLGRLLAVGIIGAILLASCAKRSSESLKPVAGSWQGTVTIAGRNLGIVVHLKADGKGSIDIPSQGAYGLPLEKISATATKVDFDLKAGSDVATFRGSLQGNTISGRFAQAGHKGTFKITRPSKRPVTAANASSDIRVTLQTPTGDIHGSLALPKGTGPFPVVLIIAGAGDMNRNGNLPHSHIENNSLLLLAEALKQHGIASVRYDKRGVGASASALNPNHPLVFSDLVNDASRWVENLKKDKRFTKVGVIGYDQGSLVGMVAAANANAAAFVSLAGWAQPADAQLRAQFASQPRAIRVEADRIISKLKAGQRVLKVGDSLRSILGPNRQTFLMSEFQYDPVKEIAQLKMPVLIAQGTNDLEVSTKQAEELHHALPGSFLDLINGMNHVLRRAPNNEQGNLATYSNPDLPLDPELVQDLSAFLQSTMVPINAHTGAPKQHPAAAKQDAGAAKQHAGG